MATPVSRSRQPRFSAVTQKSCIRDINGNPLSVRSLDGLKQGQADTLLHMDDCDDPSCPDLAQLRDLQKSWDRFTDYDNYEKCCDAHHHHHTQEHIDECCEGSPEQCMTPDGTCDTEDCRECDDQHRDCFDDVDVRDLDCEQCEEECEELGHGLQECPQNHPTSRDNCVFAHHVPLPALGPTDDFDMHGVPLPLRGLTPCTDDCNIPPPTQSYQGDFIVAGTPFDPDLDHWQTFQQAHHCAPDPCTLGQVPQYLIPQHLTPDFGFTFGCDPSLAANQYPWQKQTVHCAVPTNLPVTFPAHQSMSYAALPLANPETALPLRTRQPRDMTCQDASNNTPTPPPRVCQWIMPCGSICGANFPTTTSLKAHVKNSHSTKGVLACCWATRSSATESAATSTDSPSASNKRCMAAFATEAALTGHISKKHLTFPNDESGPWKCTFPDCPKSFAYKQVRDDHVASHNGGNKVHCPICHQWLNAEGSNFRRHMASHESRDSHMRCKYEGVGCKRRFPRLDNLRRHEACCKFGKRARGVHHHHHTVHNHAGK